MCPVDLNRLPDIFLAKMGLFEISRELQFGICNHGESCVSPCVAREKVFTERKRKLE